jgi:hypothetical protein
MRARYFSVLALTLISASASQRPTQLRFAVTFPVERSRRAQVPDQ